jgi:hypothetical protein
MIPSLGFVYIIYSMASKRSTALIEIMRIEDQVNRVTKDKRYRRIQENVKALKTSYGRAIVKIGNPEDMEKMITVRKNSVDAKGYLKTYELMLFEYDVLMLELRKQKSKLRKQLF